MQQENPNAAHESDDLFSAASQDESGLKEEEGLEEEGNTADSSDDSVEDETDSAASETEPNIIFVGDGEPTTKINDGMATYKLPKVEIQADVEIVPPSKEGEVETTVYTGKPFYHKNAGAIIQLFPDQYKRFVKKGS